MLFKSIGLSASMLAMLNMTAAQATTPDIIISCFGVKKTCTKNQIAITNKWTTKSVSDVTVSCPNKDNPKGEAYTFMSFDLDANETNCMSVADSCLITDGIFVRKNIEVTVTAKGYPGWSKSSLCTWKNFKK